MKTMQGEAYAELLRMFRNALTQPQRRRLAVHAKKDTPILCRKNASLYADGNGGG